MMVNTRDGKLNGRNTFMVGIRLPDSTWPALKKLADTKEMTIGEYIKDRILYLANKVDTVNTTPEATHSVNKLTKQTLQAMIHRIESKPAIDPITMELQKETMQKYYPWYNPELHTTGDTVRMRDPKTKEVKVVTL